MNQLELLNLEMKSEKKRRKSMLATSVQTPDKNTDSQKELQQKVIGFDNLFEFPEELEKHIENVDHLRLDDKKSSNYDSLEMSLKKSKRRKSKNYYSQSNKSRFYSSNMNK